MPHVIQTTMPLSTQIVMNILKYIQVLYTKVLKFRLHMSIFYKASFFRQVLAGCLILLSILRSMCFFGFSLLTTKSLHNQMLNTVMEAKMRFFDLNPIGRIMNRFSKDVGNIDDILPSTMHEAIQVRHPITKCKSPLSKRIRFSLHVLKVFYDGLWISCFGKYNQLLDFNITCANSSFFCLYSILFSKNFKRIETY